MVELKVMTPAERNYCYSQISEVESRSGCIGHLRADMDSSGEGFFYRWEDHGGYPKSDEFKKEFDVLINELRFGESEGRIFENRSRLSRFCNSHPDAAINGREFGFRVDTEMYSYMFRFNPNRGEYDIYCYCFSRERISEHLKNAETGIRFVDSRDNDLFRIADGGRIEVTDLSGNQEIYTCRFIDELHVAIYDNIYQISQYAEMCEKSGYKVIPLEGVIS